ncbi:phospholipase D-like domain-containing protein [Microlunatus panaciterrae]|uniref:Cardiolipin synthase n=1 Tax=Microlunatus panaciterrae TaxID=400768 RepID=A0ABS2RKW9_9ACTN|nr:phosphatidylserine/phosphatidylglycerophosphate/cardiolipin synthase family protein [Microlunatus panaciterrae]MBM7799655.1 cardiolipin synthase [Microlunatus panaciterrae]
MWLSRIPVRKIIKRTALAVAAVQAATIGTLLVVDHRRKRNRAPAVFPRVPARSVTAGTSEVTVYTYGEDLFYDMLGAIRQAKHRIFFETYIWKGDAVGQSFKQALIDAADRGVDVYVAFDEFANLVVPRSFFHFPDNVKVQRHPLVGGGYRFLHPRYSGRDHRKLLVVDDDAAFLGGYNIGSLYATDWRDTHARLTGDIVWDVQNAFIDYWNLSANKHRIPDRGSLHWQPTIRLHRNIPRHFVYPIRGMYLEAIDRAAHHVYLTHAYLIPDEDMLRALIQAARRGVDVRIIVPAESNHIVADWLSRGYYSQLLRGGIRLFLYQGAMVHAKTATIDGQWSTIGTANIDRLSLTGNYEINMEVFDRDVARQMEHIFEVDLSNTIELTLEKWHARHAMVKFSETVLTPLRPLL